MSAGAGVGESNDKDHGNQREKPPCALPKYGKKCKIFPVDK
jgi:hypothetical protein